jgi:ClpP class serine protease
VTGGFGQGRVVGAEKAVLTGMADRVATIDEVISDLAASSQGSKQARADDRDYRLRRLRALSR